MSVLPELAQIFYAQWDADHVGQGDCVPTSAKMLIRYYTGREERIDDIRAAMDLAEDGVQDLARDAGITLEAARIALTTTYGMPCAAAYARDIHFDELLAYVRAGRLPIVFELHGELPTRQDLAFGGLHAVWLVRDNGDGTLEVKDPDRWGLHKADRWILEAADFRRAYVAGAALGGGAVIPNEAREEEILVLTDADKSWIEQVVETKLIAVRENLKGELVGAIKAGFNETLPTLLDRLAAGDKKVETAELET